jgi:pimeloyl-ACP methyl ester carboxylesterase
MSQPDVICLNTSHFLKRFNLPLLRYLSQQVTISQWEYEQDYDEPSDMNRAVDLFHEYLITLGKPVHLIGHGISGYLGLLYARKYTFQVKSLTLIAVGVSPTINWQSQYYCHRLYSATADRHILLVKMAYQLFGYRDPDILERLAVLLSGDLDYALSPHSLFEQISAPVRACPVPLLIYGTEDDAVIDKSAIEDWKPLLKPSDRLSLIPHGLHFFHYFHSQEVGRGIIKFWRDLSENGAIKSLLNIQMRGL